MFGWFWKWMARDVDLSGIVLDDPVVWEVSPPRDASAFFLELEDLLPDGAILYLEQPLDLEVLSYVESYQLPAPEKVKIGTIWPRSAWYHIAANSKNLAELSSLASDTEKLDICIHLVAYKDRQVLLSWHDAWTDPMWLSRQFEETVVAAFSERLGSTFRLYEVADDPLTWRQQHGHFWRRSAR